MGEPAPIGGEFGDPIRAPFAAADAVVDQLKQITPAMSSSLGGQLSRPDGWDGASRGA